MKCIKLIFLLLTLAIYIPVYSHGITIRQKIEDLRKNSKAHIIYDSNLKLDLPANSVKWIRKGNNIIITPLEGNRGKMENTKKNDSKRLKKLKHTISGYVKDENEEPLINATIFDENTKTATMSNEQGFFSITLPDGKHRLEVSYLG